ncbi:hypothetical protein [Jejuia pallidilutea]|uniref:SGNH/GDSL hydrolase family protein n=1 Tax=Jejuia pallidilutea TaxID=504487 RepID=A0A090VSU2_9FLAO|nr:hypothetical protein [Jejuia pallidilutea]GAL67038.1 hypothetical protein JCM19301_2203 [Jejuia pallidilutea]GAL70746.1 hypothetical protein JCM19302_2468 [Jejuia pallidilutea]GAL90616.1 hypothetical protein JCM19538_381 [Jejuia pallidilutea]
MKRLFLKCLIYAILIVFALEVYVRAFHLTKDYPSRYIDNYGVEKWVPNQSGFSVTGNRRQNFSEYHINNSGFNSYREYNPTKDKIEVALVGDSFIEGFHQHYYNSIGKKIENRIKDIDVYEFGYAGYDFADQLHLVHSYKKEFDLIDHIIFGLKFENDLTRGEYIVVKDRMRLETPLFKTLREIKILAYAQSIGIIDPVRKAPGKLISFFKGGNKQKTELTEEEQLLKDTENNKTYLENFKNLIHLYGYDKRRYTLLIDKSKTPKMFLDYLDNNGFRYIDFSEALEASNKPTDLIYDKHWNNNGRSIIARLIADYINKN